MSCVQRATDASSHQFNSFGITRPCASEPLNCFIAFSESHAVAVQKIFPGSRIVFTARLPGARRACISLRIAYQTNPGKKSHERSRKRVIDTKGMRGFYQQMGLFTILVRLSPAPAEISYPDDNTCG